jgi:hypothetical protein
MKLAPCKDDRWGENCSASGSQPQRRGQTERVLRDHNHGVLIVTLTRYERNVAIAANNAVPFSTCYFPIQPTAQASTAAPTTMR